LSAEVVQLVEQLTKHPKLEGSNPNLAGPWRKFWETKKLYFDFLAEVVQLVEQ
jgi:hypothetical protein